ncbi:hypothetical protein [Streptomyces sp. BH105]|uniref:hypothetical protein n=1 Tax=Streptomyces sp. BH105 TaxID=3410408 RepID=UPI003CF3C2B3
MNATIDIDAAYVENFATAALHTALWADCMPESESDDAETGMDSGEAQSHDLSDMSEESRAQFLEVCKDFCEGNSADLSDIDPGRAGHDFWLTSQGHGAGFWDGDYPHELGQRLTAAAKVYSFNGVWREGDKFRIDY